MLAFLNLGFGELVVVAVVAVLVFGRKLPQVAGETAATIQRLRRSLNDLRRETGIDQELRTIRRAVDETIPREVRDVQAVRSSVEKEIRGVAEGLRQTAQDPPSPAAPAAPADAPPAEPRPSAEPRPPPEGPPV